ncbi:ABC transporter substrate-binding protein [Corynebacterium suedekumii]|nr:ABC transporter substrate-binding protein [Corynebacterium suedekumii]
MVPVGMSKATWGDDDGDGVLPWVEDTLAELGADTPVLFDETDAIPFEQIADTRPDVILAAYSGITQDDYDKLSKIAPVVAYPGIPGEPRCRTWSPSTQPGWARTRRLRTSTPPSTPRSPPPSTSFRSSRTPMSCSPPLGGQNDLSTIGFYGTEGPPGRLPRRGRDRRAGGGSGGERAGRGFWIERSAEDVREFSYDVRPQSSPTAPTTPPRTRPPSPSCRPTHSWERSPPSATGTPPSSAPARCPRRPTPPRCPSPGVCATTSLCWLTP